MFSDLLTHAGIAIATFVVTNIDDLIILSIYFANPEYKTKNIVVGQYLGIITLTAVSLLALLFGAVVEDHWISLLGILPLAIGIKGLIQLKKSSTGDDDLPTKKSNYQFVSVALVTIANGGDNLGVYGPLFANLQLKYLYIYIIVFLGMTGIWCVVANYFVKHPRVKGTFAKYGKVILPVFLIGLGLFILQGFWWWVISR